MRNRVHLVMTALLTWHLSAAAAPSINSASFATDIRVPNSGFTGLQTLWNVNVAGAGPCSGISASFSRGGQTYALKLNADPVFENCNFSEASFTFPNPASLLSFAGATSPWSYTITDSTGSTTGLFPLIASPSILPFAQNVAVSDNSKRPKISWALPDLSAFDVDRVRLRVLDEDQSGLIIHQADLAPDSDSYLIPAGVLEANHRYTYVVMLDDIENGLLENRSRVRSPAPIAAIPEPGTFAMLATGVLAVAGMARRRASTGY